MSKKIFFSAFIGSLLGAVIFFAFKEPNRVWAIPQVSPPSIGQELRGPGQGQDPMIDLVYELGLSHKQMQAIHTKQLDTRIKHRPYMQRLPKLTQQLHLEFAKVDVDPIKIKDIQDQILQIQDQMLKDHIEVMQHQHDTFTKDQLVKLQKIITETI